MYPFCDWCFPILPFQEGKELEKVKTTNWWKSWSQSWALGRENCRRQIKIKVGGLSPSGRRCKIQTSSNSIRVTHREIWQQVFIGDRCIFQDQGQRKIESPERREGGFKIQTSSTGTSVTKGNRGQNSWHQNKLLKVFLQRWKLSDSPSWRDYIITVFSENSSLNRTYSLADRSEMQLICPWMNNSISSFGINHISLLLAPQSGALRRS